MATKNQTVQQEKVIETVSRSEQFYNEHKSLIWGCVIALAVIALAILGYRKFIYEPKAAEAAEQMFPAEASFQAGNFEIALQGDGNHLGFADIVDQYGSKAGQAVYFYAGICELQLGHYQEALSYLKKYKGKDEILSARATACIGDAYVGLEDYKTAVQYFEKAAKSAHNTFAATYLLKAGITYEELGQQDKALACYKTIEDQYPNSVEAYDISKYISRIEVAK